MHRATRLNAASVAAWPYPLALKKTQFLKTRNQKHISHRNYPQKHVPMDKPDCSSKGLQQQFCLCINYRKLNSLLPAVTPALGTKKGVLLPMPLPKIDELFALLKGAKDFTALDLCSGYYHIKLDEESIPKSASLQYLANLNL